MVHIFMCPEASSGSGTTYTTTILEYSTSNTSQVKKSLHNRPFRNHYLLTGLKIKEQKFF